MSVYPLPAGARGGVPGVRQRVHADEVGGITVDACVGGCGGIWSDRYELMRVDESHDESAGEKLLHIERDPTSPWTARRGCAAPGGRTPS